MSETFYAVGIGASAGGISALYEFFAHIPADIAASFIVVTHLQRDRHSALAGLLSKHSQLPTHRVESDVQIRPGNIYVLAENTALTIEQGWLKVCPRSQEIVNWSIDIFLKSLANDFKEKAIGIILSGGGFDGLAGAQQLNELGGKVMVQNPESAEVNGMPLAIIHHDHPTAILNPAKLAEKLIEVCAGRVLIEALVKKHDGWQP